MIPLFHYISKLNIGNLEFHRRVGRRQDRAGSERREIDRHRRKLL